MGGQCWTNRFLVNYNDVTATESCLVRVREIIPGKGLNSDEWNTTICQYGNLNEENHRNMMTYDEIHQGHHEENPWFSHHPSDLRWSPPSSSRSWLGAKSQISPVDPGHLGKVGGFWWPPNWLECTTVCLKFDPQRPNTTLLMSYYPKNPSHVAGHFQSSYHVRYPVS